jgi:hypothetical protein
MAMSVELVCVQFRTAFGYGTVGCMFRVSGLHVYRDTTPFEQFEFGELQSYQAS